VVSVAHRLSIDGNWADELPGSRVVGYIDGIRSAGARRDEPELILGRPGRVPGPRLIDFYIITFTLWIEGEDEAEMQDNLTTIGDLIAGDATGGVVALEREIPAVGGGVLTHTAPGEYITGLNPENLNPAIGRTVLQYYQDAGLWSDDGNVTFTLR
jgi:hypothetical protein